MSPLHNGICRWSLWYGDKRLQESGAVLSASILSLEKTFLLALTSARSVQAYCPISEPLPLVTLRLGQTKQTVGGREFLSSSSFYCVLRRLVVPLAYFFTDSIHVRFVGERDRCHWLFSLASECTRREWRKRFFHN